MSRVLHVVRINQVEDFDSPGVQVTSSTGQEIHLEVSFQYRIPKENIPWIWQRFRRVGESQDGAKNVYYRSWIRKTAISSISATASTFKTLDFYQMRRELADKMHKNLAATLDFEGKGFVLGELQLKTITLPESINQQNVENVITYEQRNLAQYLQDGKFHTAQIKVVNAQARADASIVIMGKQAEGYVEYEKMRSVMSDWFIESEVNAYKRLSAGLGTLNKDQLLYKQWVDTWMESDADALVINVNQHASLVGL
jgi:hypothetical protein